MTPRLTSAILVSSLIRRIEGIGGGGMVLKKGDEIAGAILLLIVERGKLQALRERGIRSDGAPGWIESGPRNRDDPGAVSDYCEKRRRSDPDLWIVELDHGGKADAMATLLS